MGSSPQLKVGTTLWAWRELASAQALCQQAEQAEALGFHSVWLPENHFSGAGAIPSPLTLLAAMAARTKTIQLGCTSYLLPIRLPLQAAEEVAVLDQLSEGRLILGLGRGIQNTMFKAFGVSTADKRKLFKTNLDLMRSAWRGEPIVEDEHGQPVHLAPLPVQQPSPPLWVAAFGPLALQQVAQLGLPYLASPVESRETLVKNYSEYHQQVAAAGMKAVTTVPVMRTVFVTAAAAQTRELRAALDKTVPPAMRERAGAVEDWAIVGDKHYVRDELMRYKADLQMTHLIIRSGLPGTDATAHLQSHEQLMAHCVDI